MVDYNKEARKAKREGDYSKAGDLYFLAGDEKSAMEMYLEGNHFALAARLLEKSEDWKGAAKYYMQSGKYLDAAEIFSNKLYDFRTASLMFEKHGDLARASEMAERSGEFVRAGLLAERGDLLDRAAGLYMKARKHEKAANVYYKILQDLLKEKNDKGYLESYRERLEKIGHNAGMLFFKLKKYERAALCYESTENFTKAAECYTSAGLREKAAELFYKMQNYDRAYQLLIEGMEGCENKELLADISYHLKKYQEAGDLYLLAEKIPRAAEAYEKGQNLYKSALLYEGIEEFNHAAELYLQLNENKKAAELYEKAKNFEYASRLYEELGLTEKAIDCLSQANENIRAAKLLIRREEPQRAVSLLQEIQSDHDEYQEACVLLGQLFTRMEMYEVALQKFVEAIRDQPLSKDNIEVYYGMALAHEKATQYSKARDIYERILAVQFGYKDVLPRLDSIKKMNLLDGAPEGATPSSVKRIVANRYELTEQVGRDAFGALFKAQDTALQRTVLIRRFTAQEENMTRNILEQTKVGSSLNHATILAIYDSGKDGDHYFICTEYVDGPTLRQYLSRGHIDISTICEIATQICLGLAHAHKKGIVHRSLAPENIYITGGSQIKISGFGLDPRWEAGNSLITKQYLSPEHIMAQKVDSKSDLYCFGIILYEMVYGMPPFSGSDVELQHLKKHPVFHENTQRWSPAFLTRIIQKCLQKDRHQRYNSASEIVEELEVADIVPGMVLNERYEIIKEVGTGGMGRVYQARDRDLDEIVALKVLRAEISADPVIQRRFVREIKVARMITHPNVVKVFDIGKYKGNRYISMEYIQGISLDEWLKRNEKLEVRMLIPIMAKIVQGVLAAHAQGIIHRDLKPQNVLLDHSMNPHVLDFGIARSQAHIDSTSSGQVLGSPKYMSPEQIQGRELDVRSDIYAVGVLMFYMFTGKEPFTGDEPRAIVMKHLTEQPPAMRKINPAVPEWLEKVVLKTLEKDRNQRYSTLKELLEDLKRGYELMQKN
jgi:serine/threonine protein kinase/tetratricopeptide (TPR) repeat protein